MRKLFGGYVRLGLIAAVLIAGATWTADWWWLSRKIENEQGFGQVEVHRRYAVHLKNKRIEQSGVLEEHTGHDDFLSDQDWMSSAGKASWANGRHAATSSSPYQPASWSRLSEPSVRPRQRTGMLSTLSQPSEAISS